MRTIVKGKNVEVPDHVRAYAERKLGHIARLLDERTDAIVELSNEHHRSVDDAHIAEVTLVINGRTLHSHADGASYQAAIDAVVDKVERQAVDHKEKPRLRQRPDGGEAASCRASRTGHRSRGTSRGSSRPSASRSSRCSRRTRSRRWRSSATRSSSSSNAENEQIAILYARADGDYGMIEPSVGGAYTPSRIDAGRRRAG